MQGIRSRIAATPPDLPQTEAKASSKLDEMVDLLFGQDALFPTDISPTVTGDLWSAESSLWDEEATIIP